MSFKKLKRAQAAEHHFARLTSGAWLFCAPVDEIVLRIDTDEEKERLLDKWADHYTDYTPSALSYFLLLFVYPISLLALLSVWSPGMKQRRARFYEAFADELASCPRSTIAQFEYARSGGFLGMIKLRYGFACLISLLCLSLFIGLATSALPSAALDVMFGAPLTSYLVTSLFGVFAISRARRLSRILEELKKTSTPKETSPRQATDHTQA